MRITVEIPDELARLLGTTTELPRRFLEALTAVAYRTEKTSRHQAGLILGMDRWQAELFLTEREAHRPYALADWNLDKESHDEERRSRPVCRRARRG